MDSFSTKVIGISAPLAHSSGSTTQCRAIDGYIPGLLGSDIVVLGNTDPSPRPSIDLNLHTSPRSELMDRQLKDKSHCRRTSPTDSSHANTKMFREAHRWARCQHCRGKLHARFLSAVPSGQSWRKKVLTRVVKEVSAGSAVFSFQNRPKV